MSIIQEIFYNVQDIWYNENIVGDDMKNKNGFTLVELLAVIAILGVLLTMATLSVVNIMNKSKKDVGEFTKTQIEDAAKTFALDNPTCNDSTICTKDGNTIIYTLAGTEIINNLSPYYEDINSDKCTIADNASVTITSDDDIKVEVKGIECRG